MAQIDTALLRGLLLSTALLYQGCATTDELFAEYDELFCPIPRNQSASAASVAAGPSSRFDIAPSMGVKVDSAEEQNAPAQKREVVASIVAQPQPKAKKVAKPTVSKISTRPAPVVVKRTNTVQVSSAAVFEKPQQSPGSGVKLTEKVAAPFKKDTPTLAKATPRLASWNPLLYFRPGTDDLTGEGIANLRANAAQLKTMPGHKVFLRSLSGHKVSGEFNQTLYRKRIAAIRRMLIEQHGVDASQIVEPKLIREPVQASANAPMVDVTLVDIDRRVGMQLLDAELVPVAFRLHWFISDKP